MIDSGTGVPMLTVEDIIGGHGQVNDVVFIVIRHGVSLRYQIHVDDHLRQSRFRVAAFDSQRVQWNPIASIVSASFAIASGPDPTEVTAPESRWIASPYNDDPSVKAASWQKIVVALTEQVYLAFGWPL
ncbi:hypothetical protein [Nocardia sp. NPDC050710]|uniref:hypothetical protein n=1 Tax=Nocardia sp. NPDC050710 TaxID=3157220 RepID=UPI0033C92BBD